MDPHLIEMLSLWGTAVVGAVATLYTVLFSRDADLRKSAVFNLSSFLVTSLALHFVIDAVHPGYSLFYKLRRDWIPFNGWNLLYYLLFADFVFYLYHRLTHSIPLLWIGHYSHHSGDRLHLSLVIRDNIVSHVCALPVGLLGIPLGLTPYGVFIFMRFVIFYQSFLHYETKRDLPFIKYFFVTPYNHVIHHSTHFQGAGQNFGGILNVWDRVAGTYREGDEYLGSVGIKGLKDPDSLWRINTLPAIELLRECRTNRSLKPLIFFKNLRYRTEWRTASVYVLAVILLLDVVYRIISLSEVFRSSS